MYERNIPLPVTLGLIVAVILGVAVVMKSKEVIQIIPHFDDSGITTDNNG